MQKRNNIIKKKFFLHSLFVILFSIFSSSDIYSQNDSINTKMSFDFGLTRGNNINVLPLFRRFKSKEKKEIDILFPFYASKRNYINQTKRSHLFPAYWSDSTSTTHDLRLLTIYYPSILHISTEKTKDIHSFIFLDLAPEINLLEFTKSSDGKYLQNNILFFLWYHNNINEQRSHLVFFPLFWSYKNKERYTNTLIPLYISGTYHKGNGKYLAVTPLYWHFKEDDKTKNILFPLWWNNEKGTGDNYSNSNTLFPFYWSHKNIHQNSKVVFPLFWKKTTPEFNSVTVLPVYARKFTTDSNKSRIMITPLFWQKRENDEIRNTLFPIWWYKKAGKGENKIVSNNIFPIYWSYKGNGIEHKIIFPVLWKYKDPLYS